MKTVPKKSNKLLSKTTKLKGSGLLDNRKPPFNLCFQHKLANGYTLEDLNSADIKILQRFLDKISNMTFLEADKLYLRESDKKDTFNGLQVIHYAVNEKFRIHGIIEGEKFCVVRLDPKHNFHG